MFNLLCPEDSQALQSTVLYIEWSSLEFILISLSSAKHHFDSEQFKCLPGLNW